MKRQRKAAMSATEDLALALAVDAPGPLQLAISGLLAPGSLAPWLILGSWLLAPGSWLLGSLCPEGSNVPVRKTDALPSKTTDLITAVFGVFLVSQFLDVTVVS